MKVHVTALIGLTTALLLGMGRADKDDAAPEKVLVLREEQGGIAGKQISVWEIHSTGAWKAVRYHVDAQGEEMAETRQEISGTLGEERRKEVFAASKEQNLVGLPARFGKEAPINPHRFTLTMGKSQSILDGVPPRRGRTVKDNILKAAPKDDLQAASPWVRFAEIADAIQQECR